MAKKSMKIKQARPQKYSTREYNRCKLCAYIDSGYSVCFEKRALFAKFI